MLILFVIGGLLFWVFYKFWVSKYKTWEHRGVPFIAGSFPFGTDLSLTLLNKFQGEVMDKLYKKAHPSPYFGIYLMRLPYLVIRDPDIIRRVLAKDFLNFRDRYEKNSNCDLLSHNLFYLEGERWGALRAKLSPTFNSTKIKEMFQHFVDCAASLEDVILSKADSTADVKEIYSRFTTDIICSCAFGLEANSKTDSFSKLRQYSTDILSMRIQVLLQIILRRAFPSWNVCRPMRLIPKEIESFGLKTITDTVEYRKRNNVRRHDFLDLLIELKEKGKLFGEETGEEETDDMAQPIEMTIELMTAQCFVFFIAGFETSSSVQTYCLYELALQQEIQKRLYTEIKSVLGKHGGQVSYQALQQMKYLDMVIHETMRKYPILPWLQRVCTQPFSMPAGNKVYVGDRIVIPTWSLHRDPEYFPDPEKFDPERFSAENRERIKPFTYMPFGVGPRTCIGSEFGLLQTKIGLVTMLKKFKVSPSEKTEIPLKFVGSSLVTTTRGPIQLRIDKRAE